MKITYFFKIYILKNIFDFREREGGRGGEREIHIYDKGAIEWLLPACSPLGTDFATHACALTENRTAISWTID